jgi:predicted hotdog family 3-hydroxylacyl-ACP dehydratase
MMALADRHTITKLIPQRHPMVMVHELIQSSDQYAKTALAIEPDNQFVANGRLREPGLIENIAQTVAAQVGYQCSSKNIPVPIGYIASIKDLKVYALPLVNSVIVTTVRVTNQILDVTVVEGRVEQDGVLLCSCEMRVFAKM